MNDMELNLYLKYPALNRANKKKTQFRGIIEHNAGKCTFVVFHVPNYPSSKGITYETRNHFSATEENLLKLESENSNFFEFVELFKSLLSSRPNIELFNESNFQIFCNEFMSLKTLHPNQKFILDKDITRVEIIYTDDSIICHNIKIKVNFYNQNKLLYEVENHSFPEMKSKDLFSTEKSLKYVHKKFIHFATELKSFYDIINRIDDICWILDPVDPTSKHISRRIVIEEGISMLITFDPWNPTARPDLKFFGPVRLVDKFLHNVTENMEDWDSDYDIIQSILRLLDLPFFPIKSEENNEEDEKGECCMCYQLHLNDKLPEIICEEPSCESYFHTECLYQWLSTISNRKIFNALHGECPICEKNISCQIPKTTE